MTTRKTQSPNQDPVSQKSTTRRQCCFSKAACLQTQQDSVRIKGQFLQSPHLNESHTQVVDPTKITIVTQTQDECPFTSHLYVLIKEIYQIRSYPTARIEMRGVCQGMGLGQRHKLCWAELTSHSPFPSFPRTLGGCEAAHGIPAHT